MLPRSSADPRDVPAARQESSGGNEWLRPRPRVALVRPPRPSITRSCCRFAAKEGIIGLAAVASRMGMAARPNRNLATDESIEPNDSASSYHTPVSAALDRFVTGNTKWPRSTRSSLGLYCIAWAMRTRNAILYFIWLATSLRNVGPVRQWLANCDGCR